MKKFAVCLGLILALYSWAAEPGLSVYTGKHPRTGKITLQLIRDVHTVRGTVLFGKDGVSRDLYGTIRGDSILIHDPQAGYFVEKPRGLKGVWVDETASLHLRFRRDRKTGYDLVFLKDTTYMYPGSEESPYMLYSGCATVLPGLNPQGETVADPFLKVFFDSRNYFAEQASRTASDYAALRAASPRPPDGRSFFHYYEDQTDILYHDGRYLSLRHRNTSFSGGAHPNTVRRHAVLNLRTGRMLGFEDLFAENAEQVIKALLDKAREKKYPDEILFSRDYHVSRDFYVTKRGVVFQYDPYEIAPYYIGSIEIFLPYRALRSVLR
ncbi:MAG: DUF3298 domain-containing protein [Candidatus Marinimicrobia bacterium]|nr:DUF3298 domain-containing protein [Candidatus Neomarinimicrobiota bacterium]